MDSIDPKKAEFYTDRYAARLIKKNQSDSF